MATKNKQKVPSARTVLSANGEAKEKWPGLRPETSCQTAEVRRAYRWLQGKLEFAQQQRRAMQNRRREGYGFCLNAERKMQHLGCTIKG